MDLHDYGGHWYVCLELRVHESFVLGHSVWTFEILEFLIFLANTLDLCMFDKEPGVVSCFFFGTIVIVQTALFQNAYHCAWICCDPREHFGVNEGFSIIFVQSCA